ncbi:MAG: glutamyl-tRNA reductase [Spirochaetaceae bacterium]|jgi:glutamyl-tRNA reductase|nr:glutamyl-tRNA reductase [Spirochaetaceae bacterium]
MIGIIGINHESAPVDVRGQLAFNADETGLFYDCLINNFEEMEAVLVSTCNRTELYFVLNKSCEHSVSEKIISYLLKFKGIERRENFDFYTYTGTDAVRHLFKVSAGLNSMILGENQILGQIKNSYKTSIEFKMADSIMNRLFHKAFQAGKRVRSETEINKGASSVSYAAVELSHKVFTNPENHPVLLIGAGEAGDLVLQSLKERGSHQIEIINRTISKAEKLAEKYSARALSFDNLEEALLNNDIIITSTASETPIIKEEFLQKIIKKRKNKMLLLIDLSVPRNIEESVRTMKNIFLFNLDDLQGVVAYNYKNRQSAIKKANTIVDELVADFDLWLSSLKLTPTIDQLKDKLSGIMENELNSFQGNVTDEELLCMEEF